MSLPKIASRDEWMAARMELLAREKELTRQTDALNADRRRLPMVRIDEDYVFTGPDGQVGLVDLFEGRRQLIVQHFMFDPEWEDGCPAARRVPTRWPNGLLDHLHVRDTTFAAVSRAPFAKLEDYRKRKGWEFPVVLIERQPSSTTTSTPRSTSRSRRSRSTTARAATSSGRRARP